MTMRPAEDAKAPATSTILPVDTVARNTNGTQSNQCAVPKETDLRRRTWMRMSAETMRKHVWRRVSASQRREVAPILGCALKPPDRWAKASQTKTPSAERSQSASQM